MSDADDATTRRGVMATERGARYSRQLFGHWSRRAVESSTLPDGEEVLTFADGRRVGLRPDATELRIFVSAPDTAVLATFASAVAEHLERFGQRDGLRVVWSD